MVHIGVSILTAKNIFRNKHFSFRLQVEELESLKSTPVKKRWNPTRHKAKNEDIKKELDDVRQSRPFTLQKVCQLNEKEKIREVLKKAVFEDIVLKGGWVSVSKPNFFFYRN